MTETSPQLVPSATARIDAMLATATPEQRIALQSLRETIAAAAPEAEDVISYGMPAFRYHGKPLVAYAAFKGHCSFFPMSSAFIEAHRDELDAWYAGKGTLRFQPDRPLPRDLVATIVRTRVAQIDAARR